MPETKRLYYFTPTKYGLKAVKHLRLKTAELDKVNDPYELLPFQPKNNISDEAFQRIKNNLSEVLQSGLTIVEYAPFSSYLPRLPQEALLCRRLWTSQPL